MNGNAKSFSSDHRGKTPPKSPSTPLRLGVALQGGGAYGAYAKGVLTTLFKDKAFQKQNLDIAAVTGTSAGAVNGALITHGLNSGGPDQACDNLESFWAAALMLKGLAAMWRRKMCFICCTVWALKPALTWTKSWKRPGSYPKSSAVRRSQKWRRRAQDGNAFGFS